MSDTPMRSSFVITPNNSVDLAVRPNKIYVGQAGDITLALAKDDTAAVVKTVLKAVPAGTVLDMQVKRIFATGTTAAFLVGLK